MAIDTFVIKFCILIIFTQNSALYCVVIRDEFQCIVKYFNYIYFYIETECFRICVYLISLAAE